MPTGAAICSWVALVVVVKLALDLFEVWQLRNRNNY